MNTSRKTESPERYILERIKIDENDCWVWQRSLLRQGYGFYMRRDEFRGSAHRAAYRTFVGEVPEGLQLDHLCRNRACCNPAHLEPVTSGENVRRGRESRLGRDYSVYQRRNGLWVVMLTVSTRPRRRKSFTSLQREQAIAKMKSWVAAGGTGVAQNA